MATQKNRTLSVSTPLGEDALLLTGFTGRDEMSGLFQYQLEMLSSNQSIAADDIVGKPITWSVLRKDQPVCSWHGVVTRLNAGSSSMRGMRSYRAEVVPALWFLTLAINCRIFPNATVKEIIETVFGDFAFKEYELNLSRNYTKWEYCVQYRETAFNFLSRLMEQEGMFYFFRHEKGKHILVIADDKRAYKDCPESKVSFSSGSLPTGHIDSWEHQYAYRAGKWTMTDYYFETPSTNLLASADTVVKLPGVANLEVFDYPGEYEVKGDGSDWAKVRMEAEEVAHDTVMGTSNCTTFAPGGKFTFDSKELASESGKSYVIVAVQHMAQDASIVGGIAEAHYSNSFTCIPANVTYRPVRKTPKPTIPGPQTAIVVGPKGEEIYTDKYGRVKVQFFWDRRGKKDENSSCWIRVAQNWAGKNWGIIFNPRIGQEVVVEFVDGDPDRPLITGRVYNAEQMPPYALPANQTQSVIKTRSSKGGGTEDFNELRFEDKKGSEDIYLHAQKDFHRVVENDDDLKVQKGNRQVTIEMGNEALQIKMGDQTTKLDLGKSETEAMQSIELKVGESSIKLDQMGVTIKGLMIKIEGQVMTQLKGLMTQVGADAILQVKGGLTMIG